MKRLIKPVISSGYPKFFGHDERMTDVTACLFLLSLLSGYHCCHGLGVRVWEYSLRSGMDACPPFGGFVFCCENQKTIKKNLLLADPDLPPLRFWRGKGPACRDRVRVKRGDALFTQPVWPGGLTPCV